MPLKQLLFLWIGLFPITLLAQQSNYRVGLTGTKDFYNYSFHPCNGADTSRIPCGSQMTTLNNFSIGLVNEWRLNDRSFLRMVPTYSSKGFAVNYNQTFTFPGEPFIAKATHVQLYYVEIPVLIGYRLKSGRMWNLMASGGPVAGGLLWQKENSRFAWGVQSESDVLDLRYSDWLFGMHGQLAIDYRIDPNMKLEVGGYARWNPTPVLPDVHRPKPLSYGISVTVMVSFLERSEEPTVPTTRF
ncbi:MAG: outer membrane beta-barrel protein [Salibacteraceae bacterium]